ncbi:MAG: hypothetical protein U0872_16280 [Planctomycetaceae bacterium]
MSTFRRIRTSWQDGILSPLAILASVGLLAAGYYLIPVIPQAWSPSGRLFFWGLLAASAVAGLGQLMVRLLPARARQPLSTLAKHRLVIPKEGLVYLVIMIVLFIGSLLGHTNMLMLVFAMMAGPFVINGWMAYHMLSSCQANRSLPPRVMSGELFSVELALENTQPWLSLWMMQVHDLASHASENLTPTLLFSCIPGRSRRIGHYQLRLRRRGIYQFGPLTVSSRFPLGLIERRRIFARYGELKVYPRAGRLTESGRQRLLGTAELLSEHRAQGSFKTNFTICENIAPATIRGRFIGAVRRGGGRWCCGLFNKTESSISRWCWTSGNRRWTPRTRISRDKSGRCAWWQRFVWSSAAARDSRFSLYSSGQTTSVWDGRTGGHGLDELLDQLAVMQAGPAADTPSLVHRACRECAPQTRLIVITTRQQDFERWYQEEIQPETSGFRQHIQLVSANPAEISSWIRFPDE